MQKKESSLAGASTPAREVKMDNIASFSCNQCITKNIFGQAEVM